LPDQVRILCRMMFIALGPCSVACQRPTARERRQA
jgi:hypothetical protein